MIAKINAANGLQVRGDTGTANPRGPFDFNTAASFSEPKGKTLVELIGIEPTTPCLQSRCSPN